MRPITALALTIIALSSVAPAQSTHVVNAVCCTFTDVGTGTSTTIIPVNDTIQWIAQSQNHTVTSGTGPSAAGAGSLFNASINPNTPFSRTFTTLGTFPYHCQPHFGNGMTGTIHVLQPATSVAVGTGCNTSTGALTLTANGLPKIGNATFGFTVGTGPAGAAAYLFLSTGTAAATPISTTCSLFLEPVALNALIGLGLTPTGPQTLGAGGTTTFNFPIPQLVNLAGIQGAFQALVLDTAAPGGFAVSNARTFFIGA